MAEESTARPGNGPRKALVQRTQLGGTDRRPSSYDFDNNAPVSSQELSRGPAALIEDRQPKINWRVFIIASSVIVAFSVWAMVVPAGAAATMKTVVAWIAENLGWFYVLTVTVVIVFVLWVALSKEGSVRLGPDHSRPQYKLFTWVAMLFAAGVGIDMLFFSVTGPISQYMAPPSGPGQTPAATQDAVVWTMFHYGVAGWAMYALLGMAMGYFAYRWGMPLSIRAALYPLAGQEGPRRDRRRDRHRHSGGHSLWRGHVHGDRRGVAECRASPCCSVWQQGLALQIALVIVAVLMTIAACTSGVDKGIRWISELNIWSAAAMLLYILVTGQTSFLLNALVENIGRFIFTFPDRTLQTFAYEAGGSRVDGGLDAVLLGLLDGLGPVRGVVPGPHLPRPDAA